MAYTMMFWIGINVVFLLHVRTKVPESIVATLGSAQFLETFLSGLVQLHQTMLLKESKAPTAVRCLKAHNNSIVPNDDSETGRPVSEWSDLPDTFGMRSKQA
jgi:hypothetical protein